MRTFKLIIFFILASNGFNGQVDNAEAPKGLDNFNNDIVSAEVPAPNFSEGQTQTFKVQKRKFIKNVLGNPLLGGTGTPFYLAFAKEDLGSINKENTIAFKSQSLLNALHFHNHVAPPVSNA